MTCYVTRHATRDPSRDGQGLADLFLDTTAFNGHGTLAQALWAAVPVRPLAHGRGTGGG